MAPDFAIRFNVAVDVEAMWHHLGVIDLGAEFGAKICGAEIDARGFYRRLVLKNNLLII